MRKTLASMVLLVFFPTICFAEQSATISEPGAFEATWDSDGPFTIGLRFRVNQPINITAFGVFDESSNGLAVSHETRLWGLFGTPIFTATVPAGQRRTD
jgi:hypothetical protein